MGVRSFFSAAARPQAKPVTAIDDKLMTTEETRDYMALSSTEAVYRLVRDYGLPREQYGASRIYRFRRSKVDAWINGQRETKEERRA